MNVAERALQLKNKVFEALESDSALLLLADPANIFELAVPVGIKSEPAYIVVQELGYRPTRWADGKAIQDSAIYQIDVYNDSSCDQILAAVVGVMNRFDFQTTVLINGFLKDEGLIRKGYRFEANILI
ncbi:tail completion protein gp17 [Bacillus sonorensis]|uniref:tail completion protein gp17 n=1 Tax=Bacillus sonorensis TaxID=119858 RepID=UPI0022807C34|nr:hypothetical protein [Bacillus sonorensis]MCY8025662.1 hypothetical protein [Bacillus sonorensis]MCY8087602.1 hypothetical protein [Bacillus sonorensis]MCY8271448.1 hypothetical protein [Bacillus sonorensis]MCY8603984.1 hypothetical protein [Bacillus sonorensis]